MKPLENVSLRHYDRSQFPDPEKGEGWRVVRDNEIRTQEVCRAKDRTIVKESFFVNVS